MDKPQVGLPTSNFSSMYNKRRGQKIITIIVAVKNDIDIAGNLAAVAVLTADCSSSCLAKPPMVDTSCRLYLVYTDVSAVAAAIIAVEKLYFGIGCACFVACVPIHNLEWQNLLEKDTSS